MDYFYRLRYSLYAFFGGIPGVEKIEAKRTKNLKDLERLDELASSNKLNRYSELAQFINSKEYQDKKKAIQAQKYKGTEAYYKEKRFRKLARSNEVKTYYKVKDSQELAFFQEFQNSEKLKKYLDVREYFQSEQFATDKEKIKNERREKIQALKAKKNEYKTLKKKYHWFDKLKQNAKFNDFLHFKDSETFSQYLDLEQEVKNYSLKEVKTRYKSRQKELKKERTRLKTRYKVLEKQARKANKKKQPFPSEQELERIKQTLSEGKYDQMIQDADYKQAIEYIKIQQFKDLRKKKRVRKASAYYHSDIYKKYLETKGSEEIKRYEELKDYISTLYHEDLKKAKAQHYKNSELYRQYKEYKQLHSDKEIKRYLRFKKSKRYKIYQKLNNSDLIREYENLHQYIHSKEFTDHKKYMKNPKKFRLSEEYKQLLEYKKLKKDSGIKWYFKNKNDKRFRELKKWNLTFEDTFGSSKLDDSKWDTLPYPAKKFISGTYSQWSDDQLFTEKDNHEIQNGILKIETKNEPREGKAWHPTMGFLPKKFNCTSAMINTGDKFRQQYGMFEAKVRIGFAYPLIQSFQLSSDYKTPVISIVNYGESKNSHKFSAGAHVSVNNDGGGTKTSVNGRNLGGQFHLFTLLWDKNEVTWKINGVTYKKEKKFIPQVPLFLNFYPSVRGSIDSKRFPVSMDIDWVRVYQRKQE